MADFDPGPTGAFATHWDNRPSYSSVKARFRMNWGRSTTGAASMGQRR